MGKGSGARFGLGWPYWAVGLVIAWAYAWPGSSAEGPAALRGFVVSGLLVGTLVLLLAGVGVRALLRRGRGNVG
jgi:hypothetical protein